MDPSLYNKFLPGCVVDVKIRVVATRAEFMAECKRMNATARIGRESGQAGAVATAIVKAAYAAKPPAPTESKTSAMERVLASLSQPEKVLAMERAQQRAAANYHWGISVVRKAKEVALATYAGLTRLRRVDLTDEELRVLLPGLVLRPIEELRAAAGVLERLTRRFCGQDDSMGHLLGDCIELPKGAVKLVLGGLVWDSGNMYNAMGTEDDNIRPGDQYPLILNHLANSWAEFIGLAEIIPMAGFRMKHGDLLAGAYGGGAVVYAGFLLAAQAAAVADAAGNPAPLDALVDAALPSIAVCPSHGRLIDVRVLPKWDCGKLLRRIEYSVGTPFEHAHRLGASGSVHTRRIAGGIDAMVARDLTVNFDSALERRELARRMLNNLGSFPLHRGVQSPPGVFDVYYLTSDGEWNGEEGEESFSCAATSALLGHRMMTTVVATAGITNGLFAVASSNHRAYAVRAFTGATEYGPLDDDTLHTIARKLHNTPLSGRVCVHAVVELATLNVMEAAAVATGGVSTFTIRPLSGGQAVPNFNTSTGTVLVYGIGEDGTWDGSVTVVRSSYALDPELYQYTLFGCNELANGYAALRARDKSCFAVKNPTGSDAPAPSDVTLHAAAKAFAGAPLTGRVTAEAVYHLTEQPPGHSQLVEVYGKSGGGGYALRMPLPPPPVATVYRFPVMAGSDPTFVGESSSFGVLIGGGRPPEVVAGGAAALLKDCTGFLVVKTVPPRSSLELREASAAFFAKLTWRATQAKLNAMIYHFVDCPQGVVKRGQLSMCAPIKPYTCCSVP